MNQQQKVHQLYNTHFREINVPKHFIVFIIGHNVACVGLYGAVNELVVIRVSGDKVETECGINKFNMPALHEGADDSLCKFWSEEPFHDFLVFKEYFVRDTQCVLPLQHRQSNVTVNTVTTNALHKAICVENYTHRLLFGFFLSLLFAQPSMKIHLVDFVKTLLVKFP